MTQKPTSETPEERRERYKRMGMAQRRHGHSTREKSPTYHTWQGMKARCHNSKSPVFDYYGGRGVSICERWQKFDNFLADMGVRPEGKTLDRIDPKGDYCPENCRWATWSEQQRNRSSTVMLTYRGETMCIKDWAERIGIASRSLTNRIQAGWTGDRLFSPKGTA